MFKAVYSYSLFKIDYKWTMDVQSSSLIFLVQDGLQMDDECSKQFTHNPYSRQIKNERCRFKAVHLHSAFEQNYNGAITCPKCYAHISRTMTFKKLTAVQQRLKLPMILDDRVSLCLHLAPCLRKRNFLFGLFLAVLTYSEGPNRLSR